MESIKLRTLKMERYVGQSIDIKSRWSQHISSAITKNSSCLIHKAIRKYGIESFEFSVIHECENDRETLDALEIYYIEKLNTIIPNGYNMKPGGSNGGTHGELNGNSKLTNEMVFDIRNRYARKEKKGLVYKDYSDIISVNTFADVWTGKTWKHIHMDVYTDELKEARKHMSHAIAHACVITRDDAVFIRDCKNMGMCKGAVIEKFYPDVNYNTFSDVWYGNTYKELYSRFVTTTPDECKEVPRNLAPGEAHGIL